jgi:hypothetical protein
MDIIEAKKIKTDMESTILNLLNAFENQSGLVIEGIDFERSQNVGERPKVRRVQITTAL